VLLCYTAVFMDSGHVAACSKSGTRGVPGTSQQCQCCTALQYPAFDPSPGNVLTTLELTQPLMKWLLDYFSWRQSGRGVILKLRTNGAILVQTAQTFDCTNSEHSN
jgi:hypothetical protein